MTALRDLIASKGISVSSISKETGVFKANVSQFVNGNIKRCSKSSRRILKKYFISIGILPAPKQRQRCICVMCGKVHAQNTKRASESQSQSAEKNFASQHQSEINNPKSEI